MIASAQAVNTSNLQDDATLYETQFAQERPTTDLAQLEAGAESQLGVATQPCLNWDGSPIVCSGDLVLNPFSCDCDCPYVTLGVPCDPPKFLNLEDCTCKYFSGTNDVVVEIGDLVPIEILPWNPCWGMDLIQAKCVYPWYWNPFTCRCECKQTVECLQPRYFSFEKCACVCPKFY
jgi:hypothetical protein